MTRQYFPINSLDLASVDTVEGLIRVYGANNDGHFGVPVAGGLDCDGDGFVDFALSAMRSSPASRQNAGAVHLVFGNGAINYTVNTAAANTQYVTIIGSAPNEVAGSEIWIDDVTGDNIGDLLIARQNFRAAAPDRIGAGALTIIAGGANLRTMAALNQTIDLLNPPLSLNVMTIHGANTLDRMGMWVRSGDISGDGIADIVVGADQQDIGGETNSGAVYVIRGGTHLSANAVIDLADFGTTVLNGNLARILPPSGSVGFHFGATVNVADLDNNNRAEVLIAATLNRAGGSLLADGAPVNSAEGQGGSPFGRVYIAWDDNFAAGLWPAGYEFVVDGTASGGVTTISGSQQPGVYINRFFGEELLGGFDYNDDGQTDLFIGDIAGQAVDRLNAGLGFIVFSAQNLVGQSFLISDPPANVAITTILGAETGAIASDTALQGDFDNDGIIDIAFSAPHSTPNGRLSAGSLHILWGRSGTWPVTIDLDRELFSITNIDRISNVLGANGSITGDTGDTLAYSAASGDVNGDGFADLIINEMLGNGLAPNSIDVGNLLVISGNLLAQYKAN